MSLLLPVENVYDIALKPRLLSSLTRENFPCSKERISTLPATISLITTHRLLSEDLALEDVKLAGRWNSAVDDWVARVHELMSDSMTVKCCVGILLLGKTCQECSQERFLNSYPAWFDTLMSHIQSVAASQLIKNASCVAMSDLMKRLSMFPSARKDATSCAGKVVQPLFNILNLECSEKFWEGAMSLLSTLILFFPFPLRRHFESAEACITSKILSGKFSSTLKEKLTQCLGLLPLCKSNEAYWVATMHNILLLVNGYLCGIFNGLEEDTRWPEAVRLLIPAGEELPSIIWGQDILEETSDKLKKRSKLNSVSVLMGCCSFMLIHSFSLQLHVPIHALLSLVERVLMVDGTVPQSSLPFVIASEQEFTCSELPKLHIDALELLTKIVRCLKQCSTCQLLSQSSFIFQLLKKYMNSCRLPALRIRAYAVLKMLISTGIGTATYAAQEVVDYALHDLGFISVNTTSGDELPSTLAPSDPPKLGKRKYNSLKSAANPALQSCKKKKLNGTESLAGSQDKSSDFSDANIISLKTHALRVLEALITMVGPIRSESWRSNVEYTVFNITMSSFEEELPYDETSYPLLSELSSINSEYKLAALRTLLASVLSPSTARPRYLSSSIEIFRKGKNEIDPKISDFCTFALFSLEALIHPRGVPLNSVPPCNFENDHKLSDSDEDSFEIETIEKFRPFSQNDGLLSSPAEISESAQNMHSNDPENSASLPLMSCVKQDNTLSNPQVVDLKVQANLNEADLSIMPRSDISSFGKDEANEDSDHDSSGDSLPDIVDADPDSD